MFQLINRSSVSVSDMSHVYHKSHFLPFSLHAVKYVSTPVITETRAMFNQNCAIIGHA